MNSDLEKEFYCSLKLVSGEEVVSLIMVDDSDPSDPLIVLQGTNHYKLYNSWKHFTDKN